MFDSLKHIGGVTVYSLFNFFLPFLSLLSFLLQER